MRALRLEGCHSQDCRREDDGLRKKGVLAKYTTHASQGPQAFVTWHEDDESNRARFRSYCAGDYYALLLHETLPEYVRPWHSVEIVEPPAPTEHIVRAVEDSRWILSLDRDWDGENSDPYDEATWLRATNFLKRQADEVWKHFKRVLPAPHIGPGPDGSIDLHWKTDTFEALVNIPVAPRPARFYADDYGETAIEGTLDPAVLDQGLFQWLFKKV